MNYTKGEWIADIRVGMVAVHPKDEEKFNCLDGMRDQCIYLAHGICGKDGWEVSPEIVANAHLIAAAPDMHHELKESNNCLQILIAILRDLNAKPEQIEAIDGQITNNSKALAKAEGKEEK